MIRARQPLPANAARCPASRQVPCARAAECARGVEPHAKGREVYDFSTSTRDHKGACMAYLAVQRVGPAAQQPRVHDTPKGLA